MLCWPLLPFQVDMLCGEDIKGMASLLPDQDIRFPLQATYCELGQDGMKSLLHGSCANIYFLKLCQYCNMLKMLIGSLSTSCDNNC